VKSTESINDRGLLAAIGRGLLWRFRHLQALLQQLLRVSEYLLSEVLRTCGEPLSDRPRINNWRKMKLLPIPNASANNF